MSDDFFDGVGAALGIIVSGQAYDQGHVFIALFLLASSVYYIAKQLRKRNVNGPH